MCIAAPSVLLFRQTGTVRRPRSLLRQATPRNVCPALNRIVVIGVCYFRARACARARSRWERGCRVVATGS